MSSLFEGMGIIGLDERTILPSTWCAFRRDGPNPRVEERVRRVEKGERVEQIAWKSRYAGYLYNGKHDFKLQLVFQGPQTERSLAGGRYECIVTNGTSARVSTA